MSVKETPDHARSLRSSGRVPVRLEELIAQAGGGDEPGRTASDPAGTALDVLVAMQRLTHVVSTSSNPEAIVESLLGLTSELFPVLDSDLFLLDSPERIRSLSGRPSPSLKADVEVHLQSGFLREETSENSILVLPASDIQARGSSGTIVVVLPLVLGGRRIGLLALRVSRERASFSPHEALLLTILAHQSAVGLEHLRIHRQLQEAKEEVRASQAQIIQAAKLAAIGELAAGVAHEIKNPLQVLMLHLEMVRAGNPLPNWTDMFSKQIQRLSDITIRLMRFARDASEDVTMEPVSVNRAIEDIVTMVQHEFRGNGIEFALRMVEPLPPVLGNLNYLQQVFLNLLINARDAMPAGGEIAIATSFTGYHVSIDVADTGSGIRRDVLEKIFDPFFTTKGEKGTGLGLAVCRKIVSQHKGELRVESEEGKGTTFTVYLPVWRDPSRNEGSREQ
jgi:signal transduction histidine kinase